MAILTETMLFWGRVRWLSWQRPCYFEAELGDYPDRDHVILIQGQSTILTETMLFWGRVRWLSWQRPCYFEAESGDYHDIDHVILRLSQVIILTETMLFWDRVKWLFRQRPCYFETGSVDSFVRDHLNLRQSQVTILTEAIWIYDKVRWLFWKSLYIPDYLTVLKLCNLEVIRLPVYRLNSPALRVTSGDYSLKMPGKPPTLLECLVWLFVPRPIHAGACKSALPPCIYTIQALCVQLAIH
jgi:hypothetical protein